jgi:NAD(P)-dependent dehydrogenase (short-subunit alcohol dehydrogenase family)
MTAPGPLDGRVALVTGGTGVIGRRVCTQLAADGARVLVQSRSGGEDADALVADGHVSVLADLSTPEGIEQLALAAADAGGIDVLVNTVHPASGTDLDVALLRSHLEGVVVHAELCRAVLPAMRERGWGRIVYVAGALMTRPAPSMGAYGAAKAAATALTRTLALEEGRAGITANIVAPGRVVDPLAPEPELDPEWATLAEALTARTALGRFATPDEVAAAVRSLVLPSASGITGQVVWVTGGEPIG